MLLRPWKAPTVLWTLLSVSNSGAIALEPVTFTEIGALAGVDDAGYGRGVAWGDYDGDGDQDLYLANSGPSGSQFGSPNCLYRNNGDDTFSDVALVVGVSDPLYRGVGVAWADYDNDGDLDIYLSNSGSANRLFRNRGDGTFEDVTDAAGVGDLGKSVGIAWVDYDSDGYADIFVSNKESLNRLYRNNGDGTFLDLAESAGVADVDTHTGASCAWADYDSDGDLDLYVVDYIAANKLYRNDGDGTFSDVAASAGVAGSGLGRGVAWGDYDNDGDLDLYLSNYDANALYRNNGDGTFSNLTTSAGVQDPYGDHWSVSVGVAWGDCDNDGDLDLYVANDQSPNRLYRNNGDGAFTDIAHSAGVDDLGEGVGTAWGDYDGDGDLDLYLSDREGRNRLFRNEGTGGGWIGVNLVGRESNRAAVGAFVRIVSDTLAQARQVSGGSGYGSQDMLPVHFGLGARALVDTLTIRWPSGAIQTRTGLAAGKYYTIEEGEVTGFDGDTEAPAVFPARFYLAQNHPNPFNSGTTIGFDLPQDCFVRLEVYNLAGQAVRTLIEKRLPAGEHRISWDGRDERGRAAGSGVYFCRFEASGIIHTRRMVLAR